MSKYTCNISISFSICKNYGHLTFIKMSQQVPSVYFQLFLVLWNATIYFSGLVTDRSKNDCPFLLFISSSFLHVYINYYNYIFSLKTLIVIYVVYFSSRSRHDLALVSRSVWARCEIVSGKAVWTCKLNVFKVSNEVYGVCNSHKDTNQVGLSKKIWTSYVTHIYKCNGFQLNFWV